MAATLTSEQPDFRLLFESLPGAFLVLRPDLRIVAVTDAYLAATRTTRAAILGRHLFEVFPDNPDDPTATGVRNLTASLDRVLSTRLPDEMALQRYDVPRPEGGFEDKYWSPLNTPVLDAHGNVGYIIHRVEDVTHTVKLQESIDRALSVSEHQREELDALKQASQFQLLVRSVKDHAITILDPKGRITTWNEGAERLKGYSELEVLGKPFAIFFPPEDVRAGEPARLLEEAARQGHVEYEGWHLRKDGSRFWADATLTPLRDDRGTLTGYAKLTRDLTERKRAESALCQSESRYRTLFENSFEAILLTCPEGAILDANPAACRLFGLTLEEFRRLGRAAVVDTADPRLAAALATRRETGHFKGVLTFKRKDGSRFEGELTSTIFEGEDGSLRTSMIIRDITASMQAERALQEREARFRTLLEAAPDAIVLVDRKGRIVQVNARTEQLFGFSRKELEGRPVEDLVPGLLRVVHTHRRGRLHADPHARVLGPGRELYGLRKDGTEFPVDISLSPLKTPDGLLVIASIRDVSTHKLLEASLRESEDRYRRLVELSPEAVMVDKDWRIIYSNPAGARLLEAAGTDAIIGKSLLDFVHPDGRETFKARIAQARHAGTTSVQVEERLVRLDGTIATVETTVSPFLLNGEPAVMALIRDVTERKRDVEEMALRTAELKKSEELNRLKDYLLSTISHELKTPIALIVGYAELLEEVGPTAEIIDGINDGARRLTEHLEQILDYSALIGGMLPPADSEVDLAEVAAHVRAILEPTVARKGLTFEVEVAPDTPIVLGDTRRITQILLELLENAEKFTPSGGRLGVRIGPEGAYVRIDVWDTGPGIPEKDFGTIWDAFHQLSLKDTERMGGLGLGLSIVKELVDLLGGRVALVSHEGKGATFTVLLPTGGEAPTAHQAAGLATRGEASAP